MQLLYLLQDSGEKKNLCQIKYVNHNNESHTG